MMAKDPQLPGDVGPAGAQALALVSGWRALGSKTGLALLSFWVVLGLVYLVPSPLQQLLRSAAEPLVSKPSLPGVPVAPAKARAETPGPETAGAGNTAAGQGAGAAVDGKPRGAKTAAAAGGGLEPIQRPRALAHFAAALRRTASKRKGAVTRVAHYGDSLIDLDHITAPLRRIFHKRYGDAGHGFALLAKPWPWYNQLGIGLQRGGGWLIHRLVGKRPDGRLGLGLVATENPGGSRSLRIWTKDSVRFSSFEVAYLQQPRGGTVEVVADGKALGSFATSGPRQPGFKRFALPDGPHRIKLKARGRLRLYGAVLERDRPGVVWDNLPLVSARFHQLARVDAAHWKAQLAHRAPDLVVYQFGANDTLNYGGDLARYGERIGVVLQRMREALPKASCLVIGPLDRLQRIGGALRSPGVVRRVSDRQREVALQRGCAFWDGQKGMGGPGAMRDWLDDGLALKDMVHLNPKGGSKLARRLDRALSAALAGLGKSR